MIFVIFIFYVCLVLFSHKYEIVSVLVLCLPEFVVHSIISEYLSIQWNSEDDGGGGSSI